MAKHKPIHPLQELVTKGEVIAAIERMIPDLVRGLDERYVRKPAPELPPESAVSRETPE